jgi:hypothetical protein
MKFALSLRRYHIRLEEDGKGHVTMFTKDPVPFHYDEETDIISFDNMPKSYIVIIRSAIKKHRENEKLLAQAKAQGEVKDVG